MMQSKKNKTLAILGSPHTEGITAKMLAIAMDAARARGDEVTYLNLYDKKIQFCRGCNKCLETAACVMRNDDMAEITELFKESDRIILASPTYWANVPAVVKNLFDRLRGVAMAETNTFPKPRLSGKEYVLLTACNTPMPFAVICGQSTGAIRAMKEFFRTGGMKCKGIAVCGGASGKTEVPDKMRRKIERMFH